MILRRYGICVKFSDSVRNAPSGRHLRLWFGFASDQTQVLDGQAGRLRHAWTESHAMSSWGGASERAEEPTLRQRQHFRDGGGDSSSAQHGVGAYS